MNLTVIKAIFKRDFVSYFSSPTGYVFICVFVMLSALATFFPAAFFNNMLANLDQLSYYMPWILLVFIPAITMSTWSEERRQGTDELLLTIPATDFDVVLGKYVAACAIFTVSLLFSLFSIWLVFGYGLGTPDTGLFFSTYLGYWFLGIAMLAIGMVASFLTRNLTVGFVLGMVFIAPLVALSQIDLILTNLDYAQFFTRWSASSQLADFQRGVISLSGVTYFVSIAAVMLYICMVLIGKRHWGTGEDGDSRWGHYLVRAIALLVIAGGLNIFISNYDHLRLDATSENINSLSSATIDLLEKIEENDQVGTILIDAYVSPQVPAEYAAHKLNLLGTLKELQSRSGGKIRTNVYEIESFSPQAETAEAAFDITPQRVAVTSQGRSETKDIFMGIAVRHKLDKVVVPFVNKGIPVEYELVRSIATVAAESRKRVGVIKTDAPLFESFSMQGMTPESRLVAELRKQYEVVEVDPEQPITGTFDVLLAVQPSAMSSEAMNHLTQAVKSGMPIAIFEDPMPAMWGPPPVPGTDQPRQAGGGPMAMFGGGQPLPKGEIHQLWQLLGVSMAGDEIVLQDYNPYPQIQFTPDFVIIDNEGLQAQGTTAPFNPDDPITSGMDQILLVRSGSLRKSASGRTSVESLIVTGPLTGTVSYEQLASVGDDFTWNSNTQLSNESFIMAVRVRGEVESDEDELKALDLTQAGRDGEGDKPDDPTPVKKNPINAIVVSDIDCLSDPFFQVREEGDRSWAQIPEFRFQNVAMVLNILDDLAGDDRFIEIRKRTPNRPGLTQIDAATKEARAATRKKIDEFEKQRNEQFAEAQKEFDDRLAAIDNRTDLSREQKSIMRARTMIRAQQKLMKERSASKHDHDRQVAATQRKLEQDIRAIQNRYKAFAFFLPPIPPILLGIFVFIHRRLGEREGVAKSRLRYTKKEPAA